MSEKLKKALAAEEAKWEAQTYEKARKKFINGSTFSYECGEGQDYYAVEIIRLEETDEYLHIGIHVNDEGLLTQTFPKATSVILYKDGREKREQSDSS